MTAATAGWAEMFPQGRNLYYEGDDPEGFATDIAAKFGLDPRTDHHWWEVIDEDGRSAPFQVYRFHCPPGLLDVVYGNPEYPLGS